MECNDATQVYIVYSNSLEGNSNTDNFRNKKSYNYKS